MTNRKSFPLINQAWPHVSNMRCLILIVLIWLADWLFFNRTVGLSLTVFIVSLALVISAMARRRVRGIKAGAAVCALVIGVVPGLQVFNPLTLALSFSGLIVFSLLINGALGGDLLARLPIVLRFAARVPIGFMVDTVRMATHHRRECRRWFWSASASGWVIPIGFSLVFVWLFAEANPMIGGWFAKIDLSQMMSTNNLLRICFWVGTASLCWPFLRIRFNRWRSRVARDVKPILPNPTSAPLNALFSEQAVFRSLLLFNGLFVLQNGLDAAFLWGAAELPAGMTYASYAHRGAYTLIFTALLAAGFVLYAARSGAPSERSVRVRWLLLLWTAQNAVLVQYCVLRLNLYVDVYALTYWRVAAFAWMTLVFAGLVFIFFKFFWQKSLRWLINANLMCLALVLYAAGNANLPEWIANHNTRLPEPGQTRVLDPAYLAALGPAALPAIDRVLANPKRYAMEGSQRPQAAAVSLLSQNRTRLIRQVRQHATDWRAWGWRHARVDRYLTHLYAPEHLSPWHLEPR